MERAFDRPNKYEVAMVINLIIRMPLKVHRRRKFGDFEQLHQYFQIKKLRKEDRDACESSTVHKRSC